MIVLSGVRLPGTKAEGASAGGRGVDAEGACPAPAGTDDAGVGLAGALYRDRADAARGAMEQEGLAPGETTVVEGALPGGQAR